MKSGAFNPRVPRRVDEEAEVANLFYQTLTQERDEEGVDLLRTYLQVLQRRKWLVIIPLLVILPLVSLLLYTQEPRYEATAVLLIEPASPKIVNIQEVLTPGKLDDYYKTQYELIASYAVAERTFDRLRSQQQAPQQVQAPQKGVVESVLEAIAGFLNDAMHAITKIFTPNGNGLLPDSPETRRYKKILTLQGSVKVTPIKDTRLVDVSVRGLDPQRVTTQANTLVDTYVELNLEKKLDAAQGASVWLRKELQQLKESLRHAEMSLQRFMEAKRIVPSDLVESKNSAFTQPIDFKGSYTNVKAERIGLQAKLEEIKHLMRQPPENRYSMAVTLESPLIRTLQQRYAEFTVELTNLSEKFGKKHPKIVALRAQMAQVKKNLDLELQKMADSIQTEYNVVLAREQAFEAAMQKGKEESLEHNRDIAEYLDLRRDVETKGILYDSLLKRLHETEVTKGLQVNNIQIVERAAVPLDPMPSGKMQKLLLGIMAALGLGVGLAFLVDKLDKRFTNLDEAEHYLQIPFLGLIPHHTTGKRQQLGKVKVLSEPRSIVADAYRQVRTNLQFLSSRQHIGAFVITSAIPNEGKSTTVANLGASFAQLGLTVLLVDADLRRPTLHEFFDLQNSFGLSDILMSGTAWHHFIQDTEMENLKVLASGLRPHNPTELLATKRMKTLNTSLKDAFDLVIYDAPLVFSVPDAIVLAAEMDGALLVHHLNRGNKETALAAKHILENAGVNLFGIVFNGADLRKISHYSSGYYYDYNDGPTSSFVVKDNTKKQIEGFHQLDMKQEPLSAQIGETGRDDHLAITIKSTYHQSSIDDTLAENGLTFLVLDVEFSNESELSYIFDARMTSIYLRQPNKYGKAVSKMYNIANENNNVDEVCRCDPVTVKLKNGLYQEETIFPKSTIRGMLVYKVPEEAQTFIFAYEGGDINILIPLTT